MMTATDILAALGGPAAVARATGFPLTTVLGWRDYNFIPEWRQKPLCNLAKRKKVTLTMDDFPPKSARLSRRKVKP